MWIVLLILLIAFILIAALAPVPYWLQVCLYVAAGLCLLLLVWLTMFGVLPSNMGRPWPTAY